MPEASGGAGLGAATTPEPEYSSGCSRETQQRRREPEQLQTSQEQQEAGAAARPEPGTAASVSGCGRDDDREGLARGEEVHPKPKSPPSLSQYLEYLSTDAQRQPLARGYPNLGNTCYMNATLQALLVCMPFASRLRSCVGAPGRRSMPLTAAMACLFRGGSAEDVRRVRQALTAANSMFSGWHQHDAHETLRILLDLLHEEAKLPLPPSFDPACDTFPQARGAATEPAPPQSTAAGGGCPQHACPAAPTQGKVRLGAHVAGKPPAAAQGSSSSDGAAQCSEGAAAAQQPDDSTAQQQQQQEEVARPYYASLVSDTFEGVLESRTVCRDCGTASRRLERCFDLSVPLLDLHAHNAAAASAAQCRGGSTDDGSVGVLSMARDAALWLGLRAVPLASCLAHYFRPERLCGEDRYHCDVCKGKRDADKTLRVLAAPEVLCLHIKRFTSGCWSRKLSNRLVFPLEGLDLSPYLVRPGKAACGTSACAGDAPCGPQPQTPALLYDLAAVVAHTGGLTYGHYTTYTRSHDDGGVRWCHFNDESVTDADPSSVTHSHAYILFYKRRAALPQARLPAPAPRVSNSSGGSGGGGGDGAGEPLVYVCRAWVVGMVEAADPGPVRNHVVACRHGAVKPHVADAAPVEPQLVAVPLSTFEALVQAFGPHAPGGDLAASVEAARPLRSLAACSGCRAAAAARRERRRADRSAVSALTQKGTSGSASGGNGSSQQEAGGGGGGDGGVERKCVISGGWLTRWNAFLKAGADEDCDFPVPPPGPMDNAPLADPATGELLPGKRSCRDYFVTSEPVFRYLVSVYGGGPMVLVPAPEPVPVMPVPVAAAPVPPVALPAAAP